MDSNTLSLESIVRIRAESFAAVRHHNAMVLSITTALEQLDAALLSATERNIDEHQHLVDAAARLATLLADGSAVAQ